MQNKWFDIFYMRDFSLDFCCIAKYWNSVRIKFGWEYTCHKSLNMFVVLICINMYKHKYEMRICHVMKTYIYYNFETALFRRLIYLDVMTTVWQPILIYSHINFTHNLQIEVESQFPEHLKLIWTIWTIENNE